MLIKDRKLLGKAMTPKGKRLDLLLEELGYCASRQIAQAAIMSGVVLVNGQKVTKSGTLIKEGAKIEFTSAWKVQKYVSRGGFKLEKALQEFKIDAKDRICLDIGASTGGFTDCLLQSGAKFVYSIDVGYGQIAWSLRTDERVKVIERTNARKISTAQLYAEVDQSDYADLAVIDVSFISLSKVLPAVKVCLKEASGEIVALVKPQFEAGPENVGKGGVVRSKDVHLQVLKTTISDLASCGIYARAVTFSPIKGPQGNIEFLLHLNFFENSLSEDLLCSTVEEASKL